ncbi:MAG: hypothetical protein JRE40_12825 [Deltaproteobacteria bacterium]|nr:hypothetical protein [Deltaproteobacteria bacterium]
MINFSNHFVENWKRRVGSIPTIKTVCGVINDSVRVQTGKRFKLADGSSYNTLSLFWHPDLSVIVSMDPSDGTCVSVLTPDVLKREKRGRHVY